MDFDTQNELDSVKSIVDSFKKDKLKLNDYEIYDLAIKIRDLRYKSDLREYLKGIKNELNKIEEVLDTSVKNNKDIFTSMSDRIYDLNTDNK